jgi:hypothetical protein
MKDDLPGLEVNWRALGMGIIGFVLGVVIVWRMMS